MIERIAMKSEHKTWIAKAVTENSIVRVRGKVGRLTNVRRKKLLLVYDSKSESGMQVSPDETVEVIMWSAALAADWLAANTDEQGNLKEQPEHEADAATAKREA
jgi:hypothetical protein